MPEVITVGALTLLAERPVAPSRSPLLFVHGLAAAANVFEHYLPFFAALGHPCYALNLRGRAGSRPGTSIGSVAFAEYVDDALEAARAVGALHEATPIVVGHSMGGLVAQQLAARGEVAAAVLISPAPPRGIAVLTWPLISRMARYIGAMLRSRPFVARWEDFRVLVLNGFPVDEQPAAFDRLVPDSGRVARQLAFAGVAVDARAVRCPMLVVGGDADRFVPLAVVRRVAARYGAPLHVAAGRAHMIPLEPGWADTAARIAEWLTANTLPATPLEVHA